MPNKWNNNRFTFKKNDYKSAGYSSYIYGDPEIEKIIIEHNINALFPKGLIKSFKNLQ